MTVLNLSSSPPFCLTLILRLRRMLSLRRNLWAVSIDSLENLLIVLLQLWVGFGNSSWPRACCGLLVKVRLRLVASLALIGPTACLVRVPAWNGLG